MEYGLIYICRSFVAKTAKSNLVFRIAASPFVLGIQSLFNLADFAVFDMG